MAPKTHLECLTTDALAERFARHGFELTTHPIGTGRYAAIATNASLGGAGPIATGDTPVDAARLAWARFQAHHDHYVTVVDPASDESGTATALRRLRRDRGLSQRRLAGAARVNVTTISRLERDRQAVPAAPTREAIARALGVSVGDVFPHLAHCR